MLYLKWFVQRYSTFKIDEQLGHLGELCCFNIYHSFIQIQWVFGKARNLNQKSEYFPHHRWPENNYNGQKLVLDGHGMNTVRAKIL